MLVAVTRVSTRGRNVPLISADIDIENLFYFPHLVASIIMNHTRDKKGMTLDLCDTQLSVPPEYALQFQFLMFDS